MEQVLFNSTEVGKGITEFGFMVMCCSSYLITSTVLLFIFIKWFTRLIDSMMTYNHQMLEELLRLERESVDISKDIQRKVA